jgi:carbonic anhydrase
MKKKWIMLLVSALAAAASASNAQWRTHWDYEGPKGPEHWTELDPDYAQCSGKKQSPIDIENTKKAGLPALHFKSQSEPLTGLVNNGYTIRVNYHDAAGHGDSLTVGGKHYQLVQFHFHRPSEEYIHGRQSDMVLHLMYKADDGQVAGVAILLKSGRANPTIQKLWDHMPMTESRVLPDFSHEEETVPGVEINPSGFLPHDLSYYTYSGSVTAPPCTEGVTWYVLKSTVEVSPEQIAAFARLYPHDVRPVQPLNGRIVLESR